MAEAEQTLVNDEQQAFSLPDSDQHELTVDDFNHQNITEDMHNEYTFPENGAENPSLIGHEQVFTGSEPENNNEMSPEQNYSENEDEQNGEQPDEALEGIELKQELPEGVTNEMDNDPDDVYADKKEEREKNSVGGVEVKKWPGWPGDSVFRIIVPGQKVGNIIGRKGEYIKKIVEETRARIKVMDGPLGSKERAVMISAKEEPDASHPPAIVGLLRVHKRIVDGLDDDESSQATPAGAKASTKFLVPATQAGILIGKQGATVKLIQESTSCIVRVLGLEERPAFALPDDRVVEVVGKPAELHQAVELIASHLRKFLVDRSIIAVFEKQMQAPVSAMQHMPAHPGPWGPPQGPPLHGGHGHGHGYGPGPQFMPPPPRQFDNYYPPADMPPPIDRQPYQNFSAYGREPPMNSHGAYNAQSAPSLSTQSLPQTTQHMQIPLQYADAVIGSNGSTISYVRRASGATVTIQETRGVPGEMTAEINGTASQVQAAQQLIQNFMADAAAAAAAAAAATPAAAPVAAPIQTGVAAEQAYTQAYSSYAAPAPVYGAPAPPADAATQAYGAVYGANYGYQMG